MKWVDPANKYLYDIAYVILFQEYITTCSMSMINSIVICFLLFQGQKGFDRIVFKWENNLISLGKYVNKVS